ncbi:hypothetical protein NQZ68_020113 [Dissostichus eleginoides]|nr:hypothetical protein NQZ68_020113 [Dissostichus eleginoides]
MEEEEGLLLILPSLSPHPPLHRLLPSSLPPPLHPQPLFPVQRDAALATILEQRWHEMEVERPVITAGGCCRELDEVESRTPSFSED